MRKYILPLVLSAVVLSGCELNLAGPKAVTATPFIITATLPPSAVPPPTETPPPPTLPPTPAPVDGTTATRLNVRTEPSTAGTVLGMVGSSVKVQIIGKDSGDNWYQILYPDGPDGKGWVTAQYVNTGNADTIPVIGAGTVPLNGTSASGSGASGVILEQVNVRSGPGTDFNALGLLNPKDSVTITGQDSTGVWLQIQFAKGPEGLGWVTASYVQAEGLDSVPIIGGSGDVVGTGTPTSVPVTVTPTLVPAPVDSDSAQAPAADVTFSPSGARALIYSSDVSAPQGDAEDWVAFTPYSSPVIVSLTCSGNGGVHAELSQDGQAQSGQPALVCGDQTKSVTVTAGSRYLVHLQAVASPNGLAYTHYTLTIQTAP